MLTKFRIPLRPYSYESKLEEQFRYNVSWEAGSKHYILQQFVPKNRST